MPSDAEHPERVARRQPVFNVCWRCGGDACEEGCGRQGAAWCEWVNAGPDSHKVCRWCNGSALSPVEVTDDAE